MKRIQSLHYLRGLAALLVAVGHAYYIPLDSAIQIGFYGTDLSTLSGGLAGAPFDITQWIPSGIFPVAVFFLLSGFVLEISLARRSPLDFAVNRAFRIYPTFFVAFALHCVLWLILSGRVPADAISNLFLVDSSSVVPVSWTLIFEIRYYLACFVLALIGLPGPARSWLLIILFLVFGSNNWFWLSYMALGSLMYHYWSDGNLWRGLSLGSGLTAWYWGVKMNELHPHVLSEFDELVAALLVFSAAVWMVPTTIREVRILKFLGDISYPLYCVHLAIILVLWYWLAGVVHTMLIPLLSLVMSVLAAYVVHATIEGPFIQYGRVISEKITGQIGWMSPASWRESRTKND